MLVKVTNLCKTKVSRAKALNIGVYSNKLIQPKGIKVGLKVLPNKRSKVIREEFITPEILHLVKAGLLKLERLDGKPFGAESVPKKREAKKKLVFKPRKIENPIVVKATKEEEKVVLDQLEGAPVDVVVPDPSIETVKFTRVEVESMSRTELVALGEDMGYTINKRSTKECVEQFLDLQNGIDES